MPVKLEFEDSSSKVLPEIIELLDQMIKLYNDWEGPSYLKVDTGRASNPESQSPTKSRYEMYDRKEDLLKAITQNCPRACFIKVK